MGFALGFGKTEEDFVKSEENIILDYATQLWEPGSYVSEELARDVQKFVNERGEAYRDAAEEYKTAEDHPDRYSSYYATVLNDASHLAVILRCLHINRRHPLSPDGWACLSNSHIFYITSWELSGRKEKAA